MRKIVFAAVGALLLANSAQLVAQSALKGSRTTMRRQNTVAQNHEYTFLRTERDVQRFISMGLLVPVKGSESLTLVNVSFPYARPAVKVFAERLGSQYHAACGQKLVITSLTRPTSKQPANASDLSVHPAGMALDIRVSNRHQCRQWLEKTLVSLERKGVLDATRERSPAHYHVAIFPAKYEQYVAQLNAASTRKLASRPTVRERIEDAEPKLAQGEVSTEAPTGSLPTAATSATHKVRSGETLWSIARRHGVTVTALQDANQLSSSKIKPGQTLAIPRVGGSAGD